jgi:glutamate racemase
MTLTHTAPVGVFDSGIGGFSVLRALRKALPRETFVYFADTRHNPYGVKSEEFVVERSLLIVQTLIAEHQIKALVVACNTATAAAIGLLRLAYPRLPIIGVEPALKPAALATRTGQVLVLATRGTLQSEKFALLKGRLESEHAASDKGRALSFTCVPCDGLADRIEQLAAGSVAWQDAPDLIAACAQYMPASERFDFQNEGGFDTLVLGCTHYPLIREVFLSLAGEAVTIVDNACPVALRTVELLEGLRAPSEQTGSVLWRSSADEMQLMQAARFWGVA